MVIRILRLYGAIFRIYIPPLDESQIVTEVTIPEGYVWCETRIITDEVPIDTTEEIEFTPERRTVVFEKLTPSSTEAEYWTATPKVITRTFPKPRTRIITMRPPRPFRTEIFTPTTVDEWTAWPQTNVRTIEMPLPTTAYTRIGSSKGYTLVEKFPTTKIVTHVLTPATAIRTRGFRTVIIRERPTPEIIEETRTAATTEEETVTIPPVIFTRTPRRPSTKIRTITPRTPGFTENKTPTTLVTFTIPVLTEVPKDKCLNGTTLGVSFVEETEVEDFDSTVYRPQTSIYYPSVYIITNKITPTSTETYTISVPEATEETEVERPATKVIIYIPKTPEERQTMTETDIDTFDFTIPERTEEETIEGDTTETDRQTPRRTTFYETKWPPKVYTLLPTRKPTPMETTIKIEIIELEEDTTIETVTPVSRVQTFSPYVIVLTETFSPGTSRRTVITPQTTIGARNRPTPATQTDIKIPDIHTKPSERRTPSTIATIIITRTESPFVETEEAPETSVDEVFPTVGTKIERITPSSHRTRTFTPKTSVYSEEEMESTIVIDELEVMTDYVTKTGKPVTARTLVFTDEETEIQWVTPTITDKTKITPSEKTIIETVKQPTTAMFTIVPETNVSEIMTATPYQPVYITIPHRTRKETQVFTGMPTFSIPPKIITDEETFTMPETATFDHTLRPRTRTARERETTIKIIIREGEETPESKGTQTTVSEIYTPIVKIITQAIPTGTEATEDLTPATEIDTYNRETDSTIQRERTRPTPIYTDIITESSTEEVNETVEIRTFTVSKPSPYIWTKIIYPWTFPRERRTKSTLIAPTYTIPTKVDTKTEKGTTIKIIINEVPERENEDDVSVYTDTDVYTPHTVSYTDKRRPTKTATLTRTIPNLEFTRIQDTEKTHTLSWAPEIFSEIEKITPTEIDERTITIPPRPRRTRFPPQTRTFIFTPQSPIYTDYITPTSTTDIEITPELETYTDFRTLPTPETEVRTILPGTFEEVERTESTRIITRTQPTRGYTCIYPTPTTVVTCSSNRRRPPCTKEIFQRWIMRLKICVDAIIQEEGINFEDFFENSTLIPKLEIIVKDCIIRIGDTHCRNKTFNLVKWVLEKEVVVVGGYGENSGNQSDDSVHIPYRTKKCVTLIVKPALEACFPGLHQVLMEIIIYGKRTSEVKIPGKQPTDCLLQVFRHCNAITRRRIETILEVTLGVCITLTKPNERSGCKRIPDDSIKKECSEEFVITRIVYEFRTCILGNIKKTPAKNGIYSVDQIIAAGLQCSAMMHSNCYITKEISFEPLWSDFIQFIIAHIAKNDGCGMQIVSKECKECIRSLIILVPRLDEVDDVEVLLQPILNCLQSTLTKCPDRVSTDIPTMIIHITRSRQVILHPMPIPRPWAPIETVIESVKITDDGIDICESIFMPTPPSSRPEFNLECIPVYFDKDRNRKTLHILVKPCDEYGVEKWLAEIKKCLEKKATKLGLRNPDYLTTDRTFTLLKECITRKKPIQCVPKYQLDFRKLITSLLDLVKYNTLSSIKDVCLEELKVQKMYTCMNLLHKYLALTYDPQQFKKIQKRASECVSKAIKCCSPKIRIKMIDTFDLAIVKGTKNFNIYGRECFEECNPRKYLRKGGKEKDSRDALSLITCGPGGILKRIGRRHIHSRAERSENDISDPKFEDIAGLPSWKECSSEDYNNYFARMLDCRQRRLFLKYRSTDESCYMSHIIETWSAMIECMIEEDENELNCDIATKDQMSEFLNHASNAMSKRQQQIDKNCRYTEWCVGKHSPPLSRCSDIFYELMQLANEVNDPTLKNPDINMELLACLNSVWPNCSLEISIISLPILHIPFALNYIPAVTEGLKHTSCNKTDFEVNFQHETQCLNRSENEIQGEDVLRGPKSCMRCIKSKKGFCWFKNEIEMLQITEPEFSLVSRCLKNKITDECIGYVMKDIKKKCLPLFYECSDNVKRGMVLDIIERCWNFKECLEAIPKICPENFQNVVQDIYFEILGLNSVPQGLENLNWTTIFASSTTKSPSST